MGLHFVYKRSVSEIAIDRKQAHHSFCQRCFKERKYNRARLGSILTKDAFTFSVW